MGMTSDVRTFIDAETKRIAEKIYWDIRREIPKKSGRSARSFKIEKTATGYTVYSERLQAYYADQGNGGRERLIYPVKATRLKITNGINRTLAVVPYVHGYDGCHYIAKVAEKYR